MLEQVLQFIEQRRSIRKYRQEPVQAEQIEVLLKAAMAAPSAHNGQPWQFVVVQKREMLDQLAQVHRYAKMLTRATLCIAVCGDAEGAFWQQDCAAATQNILLAASAMGLGSVWLGIYPNPGPVQTVRDLLRVPDEYTPFCLVSLGQKAEERGPSRRFDLEKVHYEKW